jgi:solute carrier family 25 carnitine/acylcarnitine transporter 20/29
MPLKIVGDGDTLEEAISSFACGMLFGASSVIVGHPLDTVKTRLQADARFANIGTAGAIRSIAMENGLGGFYVGMLPPLLGSMFFRSIQFASYGATVTYFKDEEHAFRKMTIGGVEARVFIGGAVAGLSRAVIESPLDLIKTRKQTGSNVRLVDIPIRDLYRGFAATATRNVFLLGTFFVIIDRLAELDTFLRGGVATTAAWTLVWPFDVAKSRLQSSKQTNQLGFYKALKEGYHSGTLYRGYVAGISRSFVANGVSLRVYQWGQDMREKLFLKENKYLMVSGKSTV